MMMPNYWAATDWLVPTILLTLIAIAIVAWSYVRTPTGGKIRALLALVKIGAIVLLAVFLLEPMVRTEYPEPGANLLLVMADDSQSMQIKDAGSSSSREDLVKRALNEDADWLGKLQKDFDVRRYQFNRKLRSVADFESYQANQIGSDILGNLRQVASRFEGRPAAGVILLSDGNASEKRSLETLLNETADGLPPVYPVVIGKRRPAVDLGIIGIQSSQTNFESAPVTITAELLTHGFAGKRVRVLLKDENGQELEGKTIERIEDGRAFAVRFQTQPAHRGVNVYQVVAFDEAAGEQSLESSSASSEATTVNNKRTVTVNRGRGPFRILYVAGRPNWEMKFLRRAVSTDEEIDLVALVRIARREAKFSFRGRAGQESNPLFRGFDNQNDDTAEQHDEAVFLRLGTRDAEELRTGFPADPETLYAYDAIVLDDVEADFFTESQKSLLQKFVSLRGGGLLMLGGQESYGSGGYAKTPVAEMLPVYLDRVENLPDAKYSLDLTREGWLQPWIRVASTEKQEQKRLASMPSFKTINLTRSIKPGATVLATVETDDGKTFPALVIQSFGRGRCGAMLIGDWWRWHLKSPLDNKDMMKSWRQTLRWLVADVPRRVELEARIKPNSNRGRDILVNVKDPVYRPLDNAKVSIEVETPDAKTILLEARPADTSSGRYVAVFASKTPGAYRAVARVEAEDGSEIETRETGWVLEPDAEEFRSLVPDRQFMETLAQRSGGEVIELEELDRFVADLPKRKVPITETRTFPWWHRWTFLFLAIGLLVAEWGFRRWKGLP
jgi:uncharacterized membrane protein